MFTRRHLLLASVAAGLAIPNRGVHAAASQPSTPVNFDVPAHATDCHTHIHGDPAKFPFFSGRVYTPEPASPEEMTALHKALHIERVVIVTPSVYGPDNSATLFGIKARGPTARGVAVIDDKTSEADIDAMNAAGFRGIRLNLATGGTSDPNVGRQRVQAAIDRMKARGWHVQMYTSLAMISAIKEIVAASPVPVVFDHFGGAVGRTRPGAARVCGPAGSRAFGQGLRENFRRLSGVKTRAGLSRRRAAGAKALIAANADRIIWGTDWPHPNSTTLPGKTIDRCHAAVSDRRRQAVQPASGLGAGCRDPQKILVDNPARLYGF